MQSPEEETLPPGPLCRPLCRGADLFAKKRLASRRGRALKAVQGPRLKAVRGDAGAEGNEGNF